MTDTIRDSLDFTSNFLQTDKGNIHYIEEGCGQPIIFLHGVPTWSYLWRGVIPYLSSDAHCFAFDFLGFGLSDKDESIHYDYQTYVDTLAAFIEQKGLDKVTLVMHGFGGVIGSIYAKNNPEKIKGLAYVESLLRAQDSMDLMSLPVKEIIKTIHQDTSENKELLEPNYYLEKVMKSGLLQPLSIDEWQNYQKPLTHPGAKLALKEYVSMLPYGDKTCPLMQEIQDYSNWLCQSPISKLLMVAIPGYVTPIECVVWAKANVKNLTVTEVGDGLHYVPENNPDVIGLSLHQWVINSLK